MTLPDKHADESTAEIDKGLWQLYLDARRAEEGWRKIAEGYREQIMQTLGSSFAITVDGVKVATNRPGKNYATARLMADYPELTKHYMRHTMKEELDIELFASSHPDVAEQYRIRSFREVG